MADALGLAAGIRSRCTRPATFKIEPAERALNVNVLAYIDMPKLTIEWEIKEA